MLSQILSLGPDQYTLEAMGKRVIGVELFMSVEAGLTQREAQGHLRRGRKDRAFGDWHEIPMVTRRHGEKKRTW